MKTPKQRKLSDDEYIKTVKQLHSLNEVEFEAIVMAVRLLHRFERQKVIRNLAASVKKKIMTH